MTNTKRLFWIVIAGIILYVILDAVAQLLPPYYSPISQAESDLAVGQYGYIMTINFLNRGILSLVFLYAFLKTIRPSEMENKQYRRGIYLMSVWGIGALILAVFPTDVPSTPVSWHGAIHLLVAILAFLGGAFGALYLSLYLTRNKEWPSIKRYALPISYLAVIFCLMVIGLPFVLPKLSTNIGGLIERIFIGLVLLWMAIISLCQLRQKSTSETSGAL
jgi:hypothetical membrane protein